LRHGSSAAKNSATSRRLSLFRFARCTEFHPVGTCSQRGAFSPFCALRACSPGGGRN